MKKFDLEIEGTAVFHHTITVECENEDKLDSILDKVEGKENKLMIDSLDGYVYSLKQQGVNVVEVVEDGSGDSELECLDIEEKEE